MLNYFKDKLNRTHENDPIIWFLRKSNSFIVSSLMEHIR